MTITLETIYTTLSYCEHCGIVVVGDGDKYCDDCVEELVQYLAKHYEMDVEYQLENGWY